MGQSDCSKLYTPPRRHLASIPLITYNFLMDGPISTFLGIKIDIDNQNKISEINLRCHRTSRICMPNPYFLAFVVSETGADRQTDRSTRLVILIKKIYTLYIFILSYNLYSDLESLSSTFYTISNGYKNIHCGNTSLAYGHQALQSGCKIV